MRKMLNLLARTAYQSLEDIGIQPLKLIGLRGLPAFLRDLATFLWLSKSVQDVTSPSLQLAPIFSDRYSAAGASHSLYFLQDIIFSSHILSLPIRSHLDVGSRIDGFVAQIACSRPIDVLDIRPAQLAYTPNLRFIQGDILSPPSCLSQQYELVSSLHALEHVGLGRYGDPIAPDGFEMALANLSSFVAPGGDLMISLPVAEMKYNLLQFNSQRLFSHSRLADLLGLLLPSFRPVWSFIVDDARAPRECAGGPAQLLHDFQGFGLCGVHLCRN